MAPAAITIDPVEYVYTKDEIIKNTISNDGLSNAETPERMVYRALKDHVTKIDVTTCEAGEEDAFYVADLGDVYRQHLRWKKNLNRVKPFYAVKCNPDPQVLKLLAALGTGFDCASKTEIDMALATGIDPSRIIYAQPCKTPSYLRHARTVGVKMMTFDNSDELRKIKVYYPDAELVLRILTDDSGSLCRLSAKYGASLNTASRLLHLAKDLDLNVIGVSFHVGSGACDPEAYKQAVRDAQGVFEQAAAVGHNFKMLDIGGGFMDETFEIFADGVNKALNEYFPGPTQIIGEPGRYYVANAFTLAANVIGRREIQKGRTTKKSYMLYLNDGVYGNFSNIIFDHQHVIPQLLKTASTSTQQHHYSIWGPTCDGIDVMNDRCYLDGLVDVGDWLYFQHMGAYTGCSATRFNGFPDNHRVVYVCSEPGASALLDL